MRRHPGWLAGLLLLAACAQADAADETSTRAGSLVNSFAVMCTTEPVDFARLDQKATAMNLPVHKDLKTPPNANGYYVESKSCFLPLKTGPHEFVATRAFGPKGKSVSCGIGAPDVDAKQFRAELVAVLHLGAPQSEAVQANALHRTTWSYAGGTLLLVDGGQARANGIYLFLNR